MFGGEVAEDPLAHELPLRNLGVVIAVEEILVELLVRGHPKPKPVPSAQALSNQVRVYLAYLAYLVSVVSLKEAAQALVRV